MMIATLGTAGISHFRRLSVHGEEPPKATY
jgi:hypothetical protein